jgi:ribokinase/sulfofructose kinase
MSDAPDEPTATPTFVTVGNALIDHTYLVSNVPSPDGGAFVLDRTERLGGVETNVAILADALGIDAGVVSRLGDDADADSVERRLAATAVDHRLRRASGETTSYCLVLATEAGERIIVGGGESTLGLVLDEADLAYLRDAAVTFASAYAPASVIETLAALETPFAFDLAGRFEDLEHRGLTRATLDGIVGGIDLFVANVDAACSYLRREESPREVAAELRARGVGRGAITSGADGAFLFDADGVYPIDAVDPDDDVVDTTGAGDAFNAGLVRAWLLDDRDPAAAGRYAAAAAALNCTTPGAHTDPPTAETVAALLD